MGLRQSDDFAVDRQLATPRFVRMLGLLEVVRVAEEPEAIENEGNALRGKDRFAVRDLKAGLNGLSRLNVESEQHAWKYWFLDPTPTKTFLVKMTYRLSG